MGCVGSKNVESKASRMARWRSTGIVALRDSKLKTFPDGVLDLDRSVRTLDLTHNKIADIPMEISKLVNLQRMILANNLIDRLPSNMGKLQSLKILTLDIFSSQQRPLMPLFISLVLTNVLPMCSVGQLVKLERLSISGNALINLPETLGSLRNFSSWMYLVILLNTSDMVSHSLVLLNISNNKLKFLPESVGSCFSLEELQANDNSLEELPASICSLVHLKSLCLNNNNVKQNCIHKVSQTHRKCTDSVKFLIIQMPSNILRECRSLQNIDLHDNPISMDQFQQVSGYLLQMDGFQEFEARRKKKFDKQIDSNVMISSKGMDEGIDL
ncbi:scaffold/adaptor protein [Lithospermum erythrorhizon]|uniref:Scaffold/adaptor protein n=1 Tax=Lithospermum erythrorhizon TaxID=34254 RepID=A0AAV3QUH9_LITER